MDTSFINQYNSSSARVQRYSYALRKVTDSATQIELQKLLLSSVKEGWNVEKYEEIALKIEEPLDQMWIDSRRSELNRKFDDLQGDLNSAKNAVNKPHLRTSNRALGDHFMKIGNYSDALKYYDSMKSFLETSKHQEEMCMSCILAAIQCGQWGFAQRCIIKLGSQKDSVMNAKLTVADALCDLAISRYRSAAQKFMKVDASIEDSFGDIILPSDIAYYAIICALATLDRASLKALINDKTVKPCHELVPKMRNVVNDYFSGNLGACIKSLESLRPRMALDIYMGNHYDKLMNEVVEQIALQYFTPFVSADMNKMAATMGMSVENLESTTAKLIATGRLPARIDSQMKAIRRHQTNERDMTMNKVLELTKNHQDEMKSALLRLSVLKNHFIVDDDANNSMSVFHSAKPTTPYDDFSFDSVQPGSKIRKKMRSGGLGARRNGRRSEKSNYHLSSSSTSRYQNNNGSGRNPDIMDIDAEMADDDCEDVDDDDDDDNDTSMLMR